MARPFKPRAWRRTTFAGLILLASLAGCRVTSPLPIEPDPCPANLALMAGQWTGMAGDVRVTMALAAKKVNSSLFGLPVTYDAMSGRGTADHPDDGRDVEISFEFTCIGSLHSQVEADVPPAEVGAPPTGQVYTVGHLDVQDVTSSRIVALLTPALRHQNRPYPFDAQVQIEFTRPPA